MIQTPAIVTFANQKGGVGKTTLCVTFANYLYIMGVRVVVIDCDLQHSISKCRKAEIRKYGDAQIPYQVEMFDINDRKGMNELIDKVRNDPSIDVVLFDVPGMVKADGLVPLLANSDIIVVPFHYDLVTVPSTASFLMFISQLRKATGGQMRAKLFMVPNQNDKRVGKESEHKLWEETREGFSLYGHVTSKIPMRADMQRFSTLVALDMQQPIVKGIFDHIYGEIYDITDPIRTVTLTGIQLAANFAKESRKKAKKEAENAEKDETEDNETSEENKSVPSGNEMDEEPKKETAEEQENVSEAKADETEKQQEQ